MRFSKLFLTIGCGLGLGLMSQAQLYINGATFHIESGATVTVQGDLTSNVDISGPGKILLKGSSLQNVNMNGFSIPNLELDNVSNATLTGNAGIGNNLTFVGGRLQLGDFNLSLSSSATITGGNNTRFLITNGSGFVKKNAIGAGGFSFPVGFSASEYNPVTLINNGTVDNYTIRTIQNVLVNGVNPATANFANNSWIVGEDVIGGSNLTIMGGWQTADELTNFNRLKSGVARYVSGSDWDLPASNAIAASGAGTGADPYIRTRTGVTTVGTFAVADRQFVNRANVALNIFLQGAYTGSGGGIAAGLMRDQLRANGVLPSTQPYSAGKFAHLGVDGGTETVNPSVFNVQASTNNNIVDWVYVTLHDGTTPGTKLQTRAALLQRDGDIVDLDGVSPLSLPIDANGNYHISVGHVNHLSVRTPNASPLNLVENGATATWDFTTGLAKAHNDPLITTNAAMIPVTVGGVTKYALFGGNTDGMTNAGANGRTIIYSGSGNDKSTILSIALGGNNSSSLAISAANYLLMGRYDLTMNGSVVYSGSGNDPIIILNALGGNTSVTTREHQ